MQPGNKQHVFYFYRSAYRSGQRVELQVCGVAQGCWNQLPLLSCRTRGRLRTINLMSWYTGYHRYTTSPMDCDSCRSGFLRRLLPLSPVMPTLCSPLSFRTILSSSSRHSLSPSPSWPVPVPWPQNSGAQEGEKVLQGRGEWEDLGVGWRGN